MMREPMQTRSSPVTRQRDQCIMVGAASLVQDAVSLKEAQVREKGHLKEQLRGGARISGTLA